MGTWNHTAGETTLIFLCKPVHITRNVTVDTCDITRVITCGEKNPHINLTRLLPVESAARHKPDNITRKKIVELKNATREK